MTVHPFPSERPPATPSPQEQQQRRFKEILGGRFWQIPLGCTFESELPGIESVFIGTPQTAGKKPESAFIYLRYEDPNNSKQRAVTLSLSAAGNISGKIPANLGVTTEAVLQEVLNHLERIKLDFWVELDGDPFPQEAWGGEGGDTIGDGQEEREKIGPTLDSRRLEFLTGQPDAIQGFISRQQGGFKGYYGVIFPGFVLLEHPKTENAAYFIDDIPEIVIPPKSTSEEIKSIILAQPWAQKLSQRRFALRAMGHKHVVHLGDWKAIMTKEIEKRRLKYQSETPAAQQVA